MFTEEELKQILESAREDAVTQLRVSMVENVINQSRWELQNATKKCVLDWFASEMQPSIIESLSSQKEIIAQTAVSVAKVVAEASAKAIAEQFAEQLSSEWKRKEFLKAALGLK